MTPQTMETRKRRQYDDERISRGLAMLVACAGNSVVAQERLAADGHDYSAATLRSWRLHRYADRYQQMVAEHKPEIDRQMVSQARTIIAKAGAAEELAIDRTMEALATGEIDAKDASGVLKNLSISKGVNIDKVAAAEGRPTSITEHRSGDDILRQLKVAGRVVDGSAEEVPEAEQIGPGTPNGAAT